MFAWIALAPLIVAIALTASAGKSDRPLFVHGITAGTVYFAGTVYWVGGVMAQYGGLAPVVSAFVAALLVAYLAIYPGLFAVLLGRAVRRFGVAGVWLAPALWVAAEWGRSVVAGGFPWVLLGTSQASAIAVAQLAAVTGVHGLSALVALVGTAAAVLGLTRRTDQRLAVAAVGLLLLTVSVLGAVRVSRGDLLREGAPLRVGLLQGNVEQEQKWDPAYRRPILDRYLDLSRQALAGGAELVIWPEASTPFYFDFEADMAEPIRRLAAEAGTPFLIGTDDYEPERNDAPARIYNAAVLVGPDGRSRMTYRKIRLVPFGEYVPFRRLLFFVAPLVEAVSDFSPGRDPVVFDASGRRFSVAICYESIDPELADAFADRGSQLLVTITNDAWFGRSSAAYQHFEQGALRAIEQGRFIVRAANTGISGAVDPYGRALARTPLFEPAVLTVDVRLIDRRTIFGRIGNLTVWLSLGLTAWVVVAGRRRVR